MAALGVLFFVFVVSVDVVVVVRAFGDGGGGFGYGAGGLVFGALGRDSSVDWSWEVVELAGHYWGRCF